MSSSNFLRLIFCFLLFGFSAAHAFFPATPALCDKSGLGVSGLTGEANSTPYETALKQLCPDSRYVCKDTSTTTSTQCHIKIQPVFMGNNQKEFSWAVRPLGPPFTCPSNSDLVGDKCTCKAGFSQNPAGTYCEVETQEDRERGICLNQEAYWNSTLSWGHDRTTVLPGENYTGKIICIPTPDLPPGRGCTVEFQLDEIWRKSIDSPWNSVGTFKIDRDITLPCSLVPDVDGNENEPTPAERPPEKPCPTGQPGQINGIDVCVPMKPESKTESRKVTEEEKILPDGTKEVTTTTTTTNCKDRMCMTTTDKKVSATPGMVTNPPPGGGGPEVPPSGKKLPDGSVWSPTGPTTTTGAGSLGGGTGGVTPPAGAASGANTGSAGVVTESKGEFCTKNPKDKQCGQQGDGQNAFGGACGVGFKCDGDAVQCAMAMEQHKMNCKLYEPDNESDSLFNKARGDRDGYSKAELDAKASQVTVSSFDSNGLGWARSCPANPVIPLSFARGSNSFEIPFSRICGPLSILALAGVGITLLGSMLWVLGGKK